MEIDMGMVHTPPKPHSCDPPHIDVVGAIWRCDECGKYLYTFNEMHSYDPPSRRWTPVRWWNFRKRRTIDAVIDGQRSFRSYT
jgi:hypothetical protein